MCSSGGGNSFLESIADVTVQAFTGGLAGYKDDQGGLGLGVTGKPMVEGAIGGLKEITGAAAAEEANRDARKQMEDAKAQSLQERENAKAQNAANQLAKSRQAASVRKTTGRSSTGRVSAGASSVSILGEDERDLLGV